MSRSCDKKYLSFDFGLSVFPFLSYSLALLLTCSLPLQRSRSLALVSWSQTLSFFFVSFSL